MSSRPDSFTISSAEELYGLRLNRLQKRWKSEQTREGEKRIPGVELANRSCPGLLTKQTESVLERLYPQPSEAVTLKVIDHLDDTLRAALALSTLCFVATANAQGHQDCSPRGDPTGAIGVLDDKTLLLADRPGNNRLDTLRNVIENPEVGLIFLLPGVNEVVRINGRGSVSTNPELLQRTALGNKLPRAVLIIEVREAFMHCPRAFSSARLWNAEQHLEKEQRPDFKVMYAAHVGINKEKKAGPVKP